MHSVGQDAHAFGEHEALVAAILARRADVARELEFA